MSTRRGACHAPRSSKAGPSSSSSSSSLAQRGATTIHDLPTETLQSILSLLPLSTRLCGAACVSRDWRAAATALMEHLDVPALSCGATQAKPLQRWLLRHAGQLRSISLTATDAWASAAAGAGASDRATLTLAPGLLAALTRLHTLEVRGGTLSLALSPAAGTPAHERALSSLHALRLSCAKFACRTPLQLGCLTSLELHGGCELVLKRSRVREVELQRLDARAPDTPLPLSKLLRGCPALVELVVANTLRARHAQHDSGLPAALAALQHLSACALSLRNGSLASAAAGARGLTRLELDGLGCFARGDGADGGHNLLLANAPRGSWPQLRRLHLARLAVQSEALPLQLAHLEMRSCIFVPSDLDGEDADFDFHEMNGPEAEEGWAGLMTQLASLTQLTHLTLDTSCARCDVLGQPSQWAALAASSALRELRLTIGSLGDVAQAEAGAACTFPAGRVRRQLTALTLQNQIVGGTAFVTAATLASMAAHCPNLQRLTLAHVLGDGDMAALRALVELQQVLDLPVLHFTESWLGDSAGPQLARMNGSLRQLRLISNAGTLSDAGIQYLTLTSLRYLGVQSTASSMFARFSEFVLKEGGASVVQQLARTIGARLEAQPRVADTLAAGLACEAARARASVHLRKQGSVFRDYALFEALGDAREGADLLQQLDLKEAQADLCVIEGLQGLRQQQEQTAAAIAQAGTPGAMRAEVAALAQGVTLLMQSSDMMAMMADIAELQAAVACVAPGLLLPAEPARA